MKPVSAASELALRQAMTRLLEGRPAKTDGRLTVSNLAAEADVSRATANRATAILTTFRDAVRKSDCGRFAGVLNKGRIKGLETKLAASRADARHNAIALQTTIETMAQHILVLTSQLHEQERFIAKLRDELARRQGAAVIPIHSKPGRRR